MNQGNKIRKDKMQCSSKSLSKFMIRFLMLVLGSCFMGLGTQLAVKSGFGADTVALFWEGLSLNFSITLAQANLYFSVSLLILVLLVDIKMIGIGTLISPVVQSYTMDFLELVPIHSDLMVVNVLLMFVGIVIISIGCALYSNAELGCSPYIGAVQAVSHRFKTNVGWVKTLFDAACLIGAIVLSKLPSIGAVVSVLISGYVMEKTEVLIKKYEYLYKN